MKEPDDYDENAGLMTRKKSEDEKVEKSKSKKKRFHKNERITNKKVTRVDSKTRLDIKMNEIRGIGTVTISLSYE